MNDENGNPKADGLRERVEGTAAVRPSHWCVSCAKAITPTGSLTKRFCKSCGTDAIITIAQAEEVLGVVLRGDDYIVPDQDGRDGRDGRDGLGRRPYFTAREFPGIIFDDEVSLGNAIDALYAQAPCGFLVMGPAGSGKSRLVRQCLAALFPAGVSRVTPDLYTDADWIAALCQAAEDGYLFIDNISGLPGPGESYQLLAELLTAHKLTWRVQRTQEIRTIDRGCVSFFTSHADLPVSLDFQRRLKVIRLVAADVEHENGLCGGGAVGTSLPATSADGAATRSQVEGRESKVEVPRKLWVVGKWRAAGECPYDTNKDGDCHRCYRSGGCKFKHEGLEFQGIFDDEARAVQACKDERYFIGPVTLNLELPDEPEEWPGARFPKAEGAA